MKFTTLRKPLSDALQRLLPISGKRSPLPILANVLLTAQDSGLTLVATNLEIGSKVTIPADVGEPGSITLPCDKLSHIVALLPSDDVVFELLDHSRVKITSGQSTYTISSIDAGDFPTFTESVGEAVTIAAGELKSIIENVIFSASNDYSRFNLNAVYFAPTNQVVATDGHRLALHNIDLPILSGVMVPKDGCLYLSKILRDGDVQVSISNKNLFVTDESHTTSIRLIEGDYPDYNRVIPSDVQTKLTIDVKPFTEAVRRVAVMTSDRNKGINIEVKDGVMGLSVNHPDMGSVEDSIQVGQDGEGFILILNANYLEMALSHICGDVVDVEYYEDGKPLVFRQPGNDNGFSLIMPMRK